MGMVHLSFEELSALFDGELSAQADTAARQHLRACPDCSAEYSLNVRLERDQVRAVLATLPAEQATAMLLHSLEGYSYKEIAEIQGCTMTAVRSRIARGRAAFRVAYATTEARCSS